MIYIGSDHAGYNLKEELKKYLVELGVDFEDVGAKILNPQDDYPDFAKAAAEKVVKNFGSRGIVVCGTGLGSCVAANKVKGARAVSAWNEEAAKQSREHLDANILCFGARLQTIKETKKILRAWMQTEFSGEERHKRRLEKIREMERNLS